jgi:hypothetical protein
LVGGFFVDGVDCEDVGVGVVDDADDVSDAEGSEGGGGGAALYHDFGSEIISKIIITPRIQLLPQ